MKDHCFGGTGVRRRVSPCFGFPLSGCGDAVQWWFVRVQWWFVRASPSATQVGGRHAFAISISTHTTDGGKNSKNFVSFRPRVVQ